MIATPAKETSVRTYKASLVPKPNLPFEWNFQGDVGLEIGAGQGLHAINYSLNYPDRTLIAVEKTHTRYNLMRRRLDHHEQATNLYPVHADASAFATHFIPDASLARIFLLYPNPYPKSKQANLRWHNRPFFSALSAKLKPGGELTLATNLRWYADEAATVFVNAWQFELHEFTSRTGAPRTHFEIKYLARGETCWNLLFRKPACLPPPVTVQ